MRAGVPVLLKLWSVPTSQSVDALPGMWHCHFIRLTDLRHGGPSAVGPGTEHALARGPWGCVRATVMVHAALGPRCSQPYPSSAVSGRAKNPNGLSFLHARLCPQWQRHGAVCDADRAGTPALGPPHRSTRGLALRRASLPPACSLRRRPSLSDPILRALCCGLLQTKLLRALSPANAACRSFQGRMPARLCPVSFRGPGGLHVRMILLFRTNCELKGSGGFSPAQNDRCRAEKQPPSPRGLGKSPAVAMRVGR